MTSSNSWNQRDSALQSDLDRQADAIGVLREKLDAAVEALERCENFIANTESEIGDTLECGEKARATLTHIRGEDA